MSRQQRERWKMIRMYKEETGATDIRMIEVAKWIKERGGTMPSAPSPVEILAKQLSRAAREETRNDLKSGLPYRVNHAYNVKRGDEVLTFWIDIDERAPRDKMDKSLKTRREQMVGDAYHLRLDGMHWNSINPDETPLQVELDFTDDVEWRLHAPRDEQAAADDERKAS